MRLVWVVIPLILIVSMIGIVGVQESFAESYDEDYVKDIYTFKNNLIFKATKISNDPITVNKYEDAYKYKIDEIIVGSFDSKYVNIVTEFGGQYEKQNILFVYPFSFEDDSPEIHAWTLWLDHNVQVYDADNLNPTSLNPIKLINFLITLPDGMSINEVKNTLFNKMGTFEMPYLSPAKQIALGIYSITCNEGLIHIESYDEKSSRSIDYCVKPETAAKLDERGWIKYFWQPYHFHVPMANVRVTDLSGIYLESPIVNQETLITADLTNTRYKDQSYVLNIEIQNPDDTVETLLIEGTMKNLKSLSPSISWIPKQEGGYLITLFFWEDLDSKIPIGGGNPLAYTVEVKGELE